MAGIGFRLQKLLEEDSYTSNLKAYAYSALIAAGPFLLTVMVVALIHFISFETLTRREAFYLQAAITYCFAYSLLTVGASYLVVTRYVADEYHRGHVAVFSAVFFSTVALNAVLFGPFALWYCSRWTTPWSVRFFAFLLSQLSGGIWIALVLLSAARDYMRIVRVFAVGAVVSLAAAAFLGRAQGLPGYLGGFVLGQALVFTLLSTSIVREFGYRTPRDYHWLSYFRKHWRLALVGIFYNLGIWADKFIFWLSYESEALDIGLRHCPVYDAPLFFAYLTIVPSLAYFLVRMETDFFEKYHAYYKGIDRQESLSGLESRRKAILASLGDNFGRLLVFQGVLSGLALMLVPWVVQVTRMDPMQMGILRIGIFAAFLQAGFLIVLNILMYFDFQKDALISGGVFFAANTLLTAVSMRFGLPAFGYGYTLACFLSLMVSLVLLNLRIARLHYWTFMRQPIPKPIILLEDG